MSDTNKPEWMEKVGAKAKEVDGEIVAFFKKAGAKSEDVFGHVKTTVKGWLDRDGDGHYLEFDEGSEKEQAWRKAVQDHINQLLAMGKLKKDDSGAISAHDDGAHDDSAGGGTPA